MSRLTHDTWLKIVDSSRILSEGRLESIIADKLKAGQGISALSEEQAIALLECMSPLHRIKSSLQKSAAIAVNKRISVADISLITLDADGIAELVTQEQIDTLALDFILMQIDRSLFDTISE